MQSNLMSQIGHFLASDAFLPIHRHDADGTLSIKIELSSISLKYYRQRLDEQRFGVTFKIEPFPQ
jgi:hypothetical protein